jgi:plastocyanin
MPRRLPRPALLSGVAAVCVSAAVATAVHAAAPTGHAAATRTVVLKNIAFSPRTVTIKRGDTVTWRWRDGGIAHNVTSSRFRSGTKSSGTFSVRFRNAGTFGYRCTIHPGMTGRVVVGR